MLINELDSLNSGNLLKISRNQRDSVSKPALDVEDIMTMMSYLDENNFLDKIATFVSTSPDNMPSTGLTNEDMHIVYDKLSKLDAAVSNISEGTIFSRLTDISDKVLQLSSSISAINILLEEVKVDVTALKASHINIGSQAAAYSGI